MSIRIEANAAAIAAFLDVEFLPAIQQAGDAMADAQRQRAPVATGRMKASIVVEMGQANGDPCADVGPTARSEDGFPYPLAVEVGAQGRSARPFIRPSVDAIPRRM
jgi:hypothetical protein